MILRFWVVFGSISWLQRSALHGAQHLQNAVIQVRICVKAAKFLNFFPRVANGIAVFRPKEHSGVVHIIAKSHCFGRKDAMLVLKLRDGDAFIRVDR